MDIELEKGLKRITPSVIMVSGTVGLTAFSPAWGSLWWAMPSVLVNLALVGLDWEAFRLSFKCLRLTSM